LCCPGLSPGVCDRAGRLCFPLRPTSSSGRQPGDHGWNVCNRSDLWSTVELIHLAAAEVQRVPVRVLGHLDHVPPLLITAGAAAGAGLAEMPADRRAPAVMARPARGTMRYRLRTLAPFCFPVRVSGDWSLVPGGTYGDPCAVRPGFLPSVSHVTSAAFRAARATPSLRFRGAARGSACRIRGSSTAVAVVVGITGIVGGCSMESSRAPIAAHWNVRVRGQAQLRKQCYFSRGPHSLATGGRTGQS
jgi:hypothetical protein